MSFMSDSATGSSASAKDGGPGSQISGPAGVTSLKAAECPSAGDQLGEITRLHVPRRHPIRRIAK